MAKLCYNEIILKLERLFNAARLLSRLSAKEKI